MTAPRSDTRDIDEADVYIGDDLVARLSRRGDRVEFDYLPDPTGSTRGVRERSVSWSLLRSGTFPRISTSGAVPAFFAGLLPEGIRLGVLTSSTKTSPDDHFTLLVAIGADTIGNVRVFPAGAEKVGPQPLFEPDRDDDFHAVFTRLTGSVDADPVGLSGVQPKVSAGLLSTPVRTRSGPAILKLSPQPYPLLVENEHFFMTMAADCGLRTAKTTLLHDARGQTALLVTRFDRAAGQRIPQEDACQVADIYPASKYRVKTEAALLSLADACARGGGSQPAALVELLRTVAFSWLIGNGDLHGKNLSIHKSDGMWQPTPAYDLLCTQPYTGWRDPMALDLYGRANRLRRKDFLEAGQKLGLRERAVAAMLDRLADAAESWPERCGEIGFDDAGTDRLSRMLRSRIDSLR